MPGAPQRTVISTGDAQLCVHRGCENRDAAGMKDLLRQNWALYQTLGLEQHL